MVTRGEPPARPRPARATRVDVPERVANAAAGLQRIGEQLTRLQHRTRFQTRETPVGPAPDPDRSTGAGSNPA